MVQQCTLSHWRLVLSPHITSPPFGGDRSRHRSARTALPPGPAPGRWDGHEEDRRSKKHQGNLDVVAWTSVNQIMRQLDRPRPIDQEAPIDQVAVGSLIPIGALMRSALVLDGSWTGHGQQTGMRIGDDAAELEAGFSHSLASIQAIACERVTFYIGISENPQRR